jgi:phosphoserine aminotransferase
MSAQENNFTSIPAAAIWNLNSDAAYLHYTANETVGGLEFHNIPNTGKVPLVSDMSSTLLSRPIDVSKFGLIYSVAQKNIGTAGLTIVIIREDLLFDVPARTPSMLSYKIQAENKSMFNTPPTFACYMAGLILQWIKKQGGLTKMAEINQVKAMQLYNYIDQSDFYVNPIAPAYRSWMNVIFSLKNTALTEQCIMQAEKQGLYGLKGHPKGSAGLRASIYNAMPKEGVAALISFLKEFAKKFG